MDITISILIASIFNTISILCLSIQNNQLDKKLEYIKEHINKEISSHTI